MPRYFFHCEGAHVYVDPDGEDLTDDHAARREAVTLASTLLMREGVAAFRSGDVRVVAIDADGCELLSVQVSLNDAPLAARAARRACGGGRQ